MVTPAQNNLVKAERKLEAAGSGSLSPPSTSPRPSRSAWPAPGCCTLARLPTTPRAGHGKRPRKPKPRRSDAAEAEQLARQATLAVGPNRNEMERARDSFPQSPAAGLRPGRNTADLTFNTLTGAFDLSLDEGPGISAECRRSRSTSGRPLRRSPPSIRCNWPRRRPARTAGSRATTPKCRRSLAAEHGAANVYLISRRFLDWATPERLCGRFRQGEPRHGRPVAAEHAEARRQIQLEYEDVADLAQAQGRQASSGLIRPRSWWSSFARARIRDWGCRSRPDRWNTPDGSKQPDGRTCPPTTSSDCGPRDLRTTRSARDNRRSKNARPWPSSGAGRPATTHRSPRSSTATFG